MDLKYFTLIFFCGYQNNTFFSEAEAITTEKQPQSTLFTSSASYVSASSQNITGNPLSQPTQQFNISSEPPPPPPPPNKVSAGKPTAAAYASSGKPAAHTSAEQPPAYTVTRQPIPVANTSSRRPELPPSGHTSTRPPPPPVYTSTQQPSSLRTSSGKPIPLTVHNPAIQPASDVTNTPMITPGFILETTSNKNAPHKTNSNSIAAILIGVILTCMLVAIIIIVLWNCLRKPVVNNQNWAGRSPFADGEIPDIDMDNIREDEVPGRRASIVSFMTWKPGKSTLIADDLEIQLFESNENIEDSNNPKTEKTEHQVNGTSEDSADRSTIATAVSSSDDADLPLPPPLLDLEGQENKQSDSSTMTIVSPLPNDSTNLPPSVDCLNQACEDHNSEIKQSFSPPPDSLNLPPPPGDFMKNQEDCNNEIQCEEFPIPLDSAQDLNESLPLPPAELL
ncbi:protein EVI2B [Elephas maximus indicus]|uniref:protein EVI2B n=1 Tax=Elephas maximus indicus TaxID=99487 RepID=UPI002116F714|nr:protein EVI2B [Elephas maximus indicus]